MIDTTLLATLIIQPPTLKQLQERRAAMIKAATVARIRAVAHARRNAHRRIKR